MNTTLFSRFGQSTDTVNQQNQSVKTKITQLQYQLTTISEQVHRNIKQFDLITAQKKQSMEILSRNLDDIEKIAMTEKDKFKQDINRSFECNEAIWNRLENQITHLKNQQQGFRNKLSLMDQKLSEIDGQIGKGPYF